MNWGAGVLSAIGHGTLLGIPNREPQEYSRNKKGIYLPGSLPSIIFLLYSWGSLFGVPSKGGFDKVPMTLGIRWFLRCSSVSIELCIQKLISSLSAIEWMSLDPR